MKKIIQRIVGIFVILFVISACANNDTATDETNDTYGTVVTSIYPVYEIVKEIAGERLDVSLMVGDSEDAHHYEPSAQAVASVNEADAFIYSSQIMEFWAEDVLSVIENEDLIILEMAENLDLSIIETHVSEEEDTDSVTIEGISDHYHTGDPIELLASHESENDHWHWFTRASESDEWMIVDDQLSSTFSGTAEVNGLEIKAELYDANHQLVAESEPITIEIDDHEGEHNHAHDEEHDHDEEHTVVIDGLSGHYHTGDLIELTASHESDNNDWHWYTRQPESEDWVIVEDQTSATFSSIANINGLEVKAELYDADHQLIADSESVTIEIDDHEGEHDHAHDDNNGTLDPHFWLDPVAVKEILPAIVEILSELDPEGATIYQENANNFSNALDELDVSYKEAFEGATNRSFVVQHQAFGHLAKRYDLEQVSVGGIITEIEPNPAAIVNILEFIRENDIPVIYYQSGENSATAETIANETDTEIATLYDLERRPSDENIEENVYIEVMYHNLEQLQKSIQ